MNRNTPAMRRRLQRRWPWLVAIALLVVAVALDRSGMLLSEGGDDLAIYDGASVTVVNVISPHTLQVQQRDSLARKPTTHVRLWGVTSPLPARPGREAQPLADEAMELARSLTEGRTVVLHLEPHRTRDTFSRLLAHVEIPSGGTLNEALLNAGLAQTDERWAHSMLTPYAQTQQRARLQRRGRWRE